MAYQTWLDYRRRTCGLPATRLAEGPLSILSFSAVVPRIPFQRGAFVLPMLPEQPDPRPTPTSPTAVAGAPLRVDVPAVGRVVPLLSAA